MDTFDYDIEFDFPDHDLRPGDPAIGAELTRHGSKAAKSAEVGAGVQMARERSQNGTPSGSPMQRTRGSFGPVEHAECGNSENGAGAMPFASDSETSESSEARSPLDVYCAEIRRLKRRSRDENRLQAELSECMERLLETLARFPGSAQWILDSQNESAASGRYGDSGLQLMESERHEAMSDPLSEGGGLLETDDGRGPGEQARSASREGCVDAVRVETLKVCFSEFQASVRKYGIDHEKTLECRGRLTRAFQNLRLTPLAIRTLVTRMKTSVDLGADSCKWDDRSKPARPSVAGSDFERRYGLRVEEFRQIADEAAQHYREWQRLRNEVAETHVGLVVYLARQYASEPQDLIDLIQEGNIGLLKAVERFNYRLGFRFSTYAAYWIRLAMSRYLARSCRAVRLPYRQNLHLGTVRKKRERFEQRHGRAPSTLELARDTGISEAGLRKLEVVSQAVTSLDSQFENGENLDLMSLLEQHTFSSPAEIVESQKLQCLVEKAIDGLNQREAYVIRERFGIGVYAEKTLQELGSILGLTRERVRQIESGALKKIRRWLEPLAV